MNPEAMFDSHAKRIHEYKRQFMNILGVIHRYLCILDCAPEEREKAYPPKVVIFSGKAAIGYEQAKHIVKLINSVARVINNDKEVGDLLKVVYLADYNVSLAQLIIPASDLSQHISTAGFEASGTSNMKALMNCSLLLGSHDGANIEIC